MPDDDESGDLTPMMTNCVTQHEMFLGWMAAGFSEEQAFELLKVAVASAFGARLT